MNDISEEKSVTKGVGLYRVVWKWHFLAGLLVLPFMAFMAVTGILNLFHDDLNEIIYAERLQVTPEENRAPWEALAGAAQEAAPGRVVKYFVSDHPERSVVFETATREGTTSVTWVNPYTAAVLGTAVKDTMPMQFIENLHITFNAGTFGRYMNEALTGWALVMFITGLYLWWPRGSRRWSDTVKPPVGSGRAWWRSLHLWVGGAGVVLVIPLLFSGLFWSPIWGDAYLKAQLAMKHFSPAIAYGGRPVFAKSEEGAIMPMDELIVKAREAGLKGDLEGRPPVNPKFSLLIRTVESTPVPDQVELHLDTRSGEVLRRATYDMYPPMAWFRSMMARLHVGSLWGGLSVVLNLAAALSILALTVSGFVAWWKRRPTGSLGVPTGPKSVRLGWGVVAIIAVLGVFYPTVGISLLCVLALDWLIFNRVGWFQASNA